MKEQPPPAPVKLSEWKEDYNKAIRENISLPQYHKEFGIWMDNWIAEWQAAQLQSQQQEDNVAYDKGREVEERVFMKFVKEWDGKTNSEFGQAMKDTFERLSKEVEDRWIGEDIALDIRRRVRHYKDDVVAFKDWFKSYYKSQEQKNNLK